MRALVGPEAGLTCARLQNRGFYYGSSHDTKVNHDAAWRTYVEKTAGLDATHPATIASEQAKSKPARVATGSLSRTARTPASGMATAASVGGRQSVQGLVEALATEQAQRLKKEKMLEQLLMDETVARIKAQQEIEKLSGKLEFLEQRLQGNNGGNRPSK